MPPTTHCPERPADTRSTCHDPATGWARPLCLPEPTPDCAGNHSGLPFRGHRLLRLVPCPPLRRLQKNPLPLPGRPLLPNTLFPPDLYLEHSFHKTAPPDHTAAPSNSGSTGPLRQSTESASRLTIDAAAPTGCIAKTALQPAHRDGKKPLGNFQACSTS